MSKGAVDWTLYLVTDAPACGSRGVVATVREAVAGGVSVVQLRDHEATTRALCRAAEAVRVVLEGTGVPLVVDDRLDVALAVGADGVHLGQSDLPVVAARAIAGPELLIGWSVTDRREAELASSLPEGTVDYLGVGPVFPTTTKADASPPLGIEVLGDICASATVPCVAIGGITASEAPAVAAAGAAGIAVVAAICSAVDPRAAASELRARFAG